MYLSRRTPRITGIKIEAAGRRNGDAHVTTAIAIGKTTQKPITDAQDQAASFLLYQLSKLHFPFSNLYAM